MDFDEEEDKLFNTEVDDDIYIVLVRNIIGIRVM